MMFGRRQKQTPGPGQESVWDYPRPPRLEKTTRRIRVVFNSETIADTVNAYRVLETSHPPVYYLPPEDIRTDYLTLSPRRTFCEYKGAASYWSLVVNNQEVKNVGWSYANPSHGFEPLTDYIAFYASKIDEAWVDDERVEAQPGDFYGGWITSDIVGPFKGGSGTFGW